MDSREATRIILERCPRCTFGYLKYSNQAVCQHPDHPGHVGGCGSEWAAKCTKFKDAGGVARARLIIERDGD